MADILAYCDQIDALTAKIRATLQPATPVVTNDFSVRPRPDIPAPAKAAWMTDPTYGSRIYRVTGPDGLKNSFRTNSLGQAWNANGTRFSVLGSDSLSRVRSWDGTIARLVGTLPMLSGEAYWSRTDPAVCYGVAHKDTGEAVVRRVDDLTASTDLIGVRNLVPSVDANGRTYARGLYLSDTTFTLLFGGQQQDEDHYVYVAPLSDPKGGTLIDSLEKWNTPLHQVMQDPTGRYVVLSVIGPNQESVGAVLIVWDVQANTFTKIPKGAPAHPSSHLALLPGACVNQPNDEGGAAETRYRDLSDPLNPRNVVQPYPALINFGIDTHLTWAGGRTVISAVFKEGARSITDPWGPLDGELVAIDLDTGQITRVAHHQSKVTDANGVSTYWAMPKPCASPDGKSVLFTSDWQGTLGMDSNGQPRQDVFLLAR